MSASASICSLADIRFIAPMFSAPQTRQHQPDRIDIKQLNACFCQGVKQFDDIEVINQGIRERHEEPADLRFSGHDLPLRKGSTTASGVHRRYTQTSGSGHGSNLIRRLTTSCAMSTMSRSAAYARDRRSTRAVPRSTSI